ncbi:hypothetical protein [Streptomyces sp. AM 2-1-1]|uniref:hypothetical protein n=1 Tax=Streptomyces sp. AM 2-1-1 TaxID=3028709 RepID=UPI0023B94D29|nr:hypothetical protein [Streptomyces sp. AM 2-1-1]WEH40588.1 hypothetical protein PZB77_14325 [Streptomyces sp. AM 2-1-1]
MTAQTLTDFAAPLRLLRLLAVEHAELPAPDVALSTWFPDRLELTFHDDFAGFEAWRDALGIDPAGVSYGVQSGGRTAVLKVHTEYGGAEVHLTGFADVPTADETRGGEAA